MLSRESMETRICVSHSNFDFLAHNFYDRFPVGML